MDNGPHHMSEFSESYHLRSESAEDAVGLLRGISRKGYVYQPVNSWVTFFAEASNFEPDARIVAAATRPLLHYVSAEDHGWSFTLFNRTEVVSAYRCDWDDDDIKVDDFRYSRAALQQFVPTAQPALLEDFERWLRPQDIDRLLQTEPSKLFARALGLDHYDWYSFHYIDRDFLRSPENLNEVIKVP
jgi:hypothetical protein